MTTTAEIAAELRIIASNDAPRLQDISGSPSCWASSDHRHTAWR